jgi:hypothetical protein
MPPDRIARRIALERELAEVLGQQTRLRAYLTARPISPVERGDKTLLLKFFSLVERDIRAQLELERIDDTIREMRSMIRGGLGAVEKPSFRTNLLRLYDESRQREKLYSMIDHLNVRKATLKKQITAWNTKESPVWRKAIAKIKRRKANGKKTKAERPAMPAVPRMRIYRSPLKKAIFLALFQKADSDDREVCGYVDEHIGELLHGQPLEDVNRRGNKKDKHLLHTTITKVRQEMRKSGLLR